MAQLRRSHAIVRAVDKAFRTEIFENVVERSDRVLRSIRSRSTVLGHAGDVFSTLHSTAEYRGRACGDAGVSGYRSGPWRNLRYLVAHRWIVSWLEHVNYWNVLPSGPIGIAWLDDGLTLALKEGVDFDLVSDTVWHSLIEWYGGGPELRRWSYWDRLHTKLKFLLQSCG